MQPALLLGYSRFILCRSQWPRGLRRGSAAARLLRLWVRIPPPYTVGAGSFPGVKRSGRVVDHPPLCSTGFRKRVEVYLCSYFGPSWPVLGWPSPLPALYFDWHVTCIKDADKIIHINLHILTFCVLVFMLPEFCRSYPNNTKSSASLS